MKNFRRSRKALSPVIASIILIAVTVAVSIAVAAWMGALTIRFIEPETPIEKVHFRSSDSELKFFFSVQNITVVQSDKQLFVPMVDGDYGFKVMQEGKLLTKLVVTINQNEFALGISQNNVCAVLTDYLPPEIPKYLKSNTTYTLETYHYWYFVDVPNVGVIAQVFQAQITAFYGGD